MQVLQNLDVVRKIPHFQAKLTFQAIRVHLNQVPKPRLRSASWRPSRVPGKEMQQLDEVLDAAMERPR